MSAENDPTIPSAAVAAEPPTAGAPTAEVDPVTVESPAALDALDAIPDLPDHIGPTGRPAPGIRVPVPVAGLALVLVALLGAAGGARLKGNEQGTAGSGGARNGAATAAAGAGAGQGGFAGRQAGGQGGAVAGTVKAVDGDRVTLTGADGRDTAVTLSQATAITRTEAGQPEDIAVGQALTVRGTSGADGTTQAATVIIGSPAGVAGSGAAAGPPTTAAP
jgi:hypothetical protein